jgi:N-acetylmuramoyl-L-alanine amidase
METDVLNGLRLKTSRKITEIILHCTASKEGVDWKTESIRKFHKSKGWRDIGYNFVIELDGSIHTGRNLDWSGAHTVGHNANSIGIVYVGGVDKNNKPKDTRTYQQKNSLYLLVRELLKIYPNATVSGHYKWQNKACPSFNVEDWLDEYNLSDHKVK